MTHGNYSSGKNKIVGPIILAATLAVALSACGRKGPLEAPSGSTTSAPQTQTEEPAPKKPDRPFILDGLI